MYPHLQPLCYCILYTQVLGTGDEGAKDPSLPLACHGGNKGWHKT